MKRYWKIKKKSYCSSWSRSVYAEPLFRGKLQVFWDFFLNITRKWRPFLAYYSDQISKSSVLKKITYWDHHSTIPCPQWYSIIVCIPYISSIRKMYDCNLELPCKVTNVVFPNRLAGLLLTVLDCLVYQQTLKEKWSTQKREMSYPLDPSLWTP